MVLKVLRMSGLASVLRCTSAGVASAVTTLALAATPTAGQQAKAAAFSFDASSVLIVTPGAQPSVVIHAPSGSAVKIVAYAYDENGAVAQSASQQVSAKADGGTVDVKLKALPQGFYQLRASVSGANDIVTSLAVIPTPGAVSPMFGVNTHFAQGKGALPRSLELVKDAGFGWIRDEVSWGSVEKQRASFTFPAADDRYIDTAHSLGLSPLVVLDYGNGLYPNPDPKTPPRGLVTDEQRAAFARYAKAVATHYNGKVSAYEIWNEPKPAAFGTKDWSGYAKVLQAVYPAIKSVDSNIQVVACGGGGLAGGGSSDCINGVYVAGATNTQDAYSIHPYMAPYDPDRGYPAKNSPAFKSVNIGTVSAHLEVFGKAHPLSNGHTIPVWATEIGWVSLAPPDKSNELTQAAYVARTFLEVKRYGAVSKLFWYDFQNDGDSPKRVESNFGLIRLDFSPKPSYIAAAVANQQLRDADWRSAPVDSDTAKVYAYQRGTTQMWSGWTLAANAETVTLSLPSGKYRETDWQGHQREVTVSGGSLRWPLGIQPRFLEKAQ